MRPETPGGSLEAVCDFVRACVSCGKLEVEVRCPALHARPASDSLAMSVDLRLILFIVISALSSNIRASTLPPQRSPQILSFTIQHPLSFTIQHPLSFTIQHALSFTIQHPLSFTIQHALSFTIQPPLSFTIQHPLSLLFTHFTTFSSLSSNPALPPPPHLVLRSNHHVNPAAHLTAMAHPAACICASVHHESCVSVLL
jgi:hypothetical protein